ncbi:MAG: arginyltransferase [Myxococcota bacterium]|nr:arginyltransferase [Myxococcota bacterium]
MASLDGPPQGIPIDATPHPCPYLEGRTAVLPLRWYRQNIAAQDYDALLASSDRRVGRSLYRPSCPSCRECQGIRVPIADFKPSKSQRRIIRRNADLQVLAGAPVVDQEHLELFNKHKLLRDLADTPTSAEHYRHWLVTTCTHTIETRYLLDGKLVGVGILDVGEKDASSVYFYFDPELERRSLGTFSVLAEISWLRQRGFEHYYLGLYVQGCAQLNYKSRFKPNERLINGNWERFT